MMKTEVNKSVLLNHSMIRESQPMDRSFNNISKNQTFRSPNQASFSSNQRDASPVRIVQPQLVVMKKTPIKNSEAGNRRAVSVARSGTRVIGDQRSRQINHGINSSSPYVNGSNNYPILKKERDTPNKRSISANPHERAEQKHRLNTPLEEDGDENKLTNIAHDPSTHYISNRGKGVSAQESEEFPKIERVPSKTPKRGFNEAPQSNNSNPVQEKLPSVEEKKKRVSALQDYMNNVYGNKVMSNNGKSVPLDPEARRSDSRDRGGNLRKKMYITRGTGNLSVLSDMLNSSGNGKSFDRDTTFNENTEIMEHEMNPEEIHYFFVSNIQKSRKLLSQLEK